MKEYIKNNKILSITFITSIVLILLFFVLKVNKLLFFTCSITANIFLIALIKYIREKLKIKFTTKEKMFLVGTIIAIYIFYIISLLTRKFIYYWDFSCYYGMQITQIEAFERGLIEGARSFVGSTWAGEYGTFLTFFPQVLFQFTSKSINSYMISFILVFTPYVLYSFTILLKTIEKYFNLKNKEILYYLSIITIALFPLFHGVLVLGQPDYFGLTFVFLIIAMTLKYDFKKIEIDRLVIIFLLTFMLTICRRWYIYWTATYFMIYIVNIIILNFKDKKNLLKIIRNMAIYGIIVIILFGVTLFPFIKNTLINNYSSSYSFYSYGGALTDLGNQVKHLGLLTLIIVIGGLIYGITCKKYRRITISLVIQYFLIVILFTRIQNMGLHHSLQLMIIYLYALYMFLICISSNKKNMKKILYTVFSIILVTNFIFGLFNIKSLIFTDISLKAPDDENYETIKKITSWTDKNLNDKNRGYLITHNNSINPDKLRNFKTPMSNTMKYIPYGSAIIGVHKFPLDLFTAKYIMTTTPYEQTSVDGKYNKVFKELVEDGKFNLVKEYKLKNNITFEIYERVEPVTEEEKNKYIENLQDESKEYKNLYEDVIKSYTIK